MSITATINGAQRQILYEMATDHLGCAGDLRAMLACREFAAAERLGIELAEDLRLMQDLGWESEFRGKDIELTMAPEDLAELLDRFRSDARGGLAESEDERDARESDEAATRRRRLTLDTCEGLLAVLAHPGDRR